VISTFPYLVPPTLTVWQTAAVYPYSRAGDRKKFLFIICLPPPHYPVLPPRYPRCSSAQVVQ
jgi:hypothetical protein